MTSEDGQRQLTRWTQSLDEFGKQVLWVSMPLGIGAESDDVDRFLLTQWEREVTKENFLEMRKAFKAWYMGGGI